MADPGSEFKPVERREAKRFEPPPWERDQFEELARQRAEQEAQQAEQARLEAEAREALDAANAAQAQLNANSEPAIQPEELRAELQPPVSPGPAAVPVEAVPAPPRAKPDASGPADEHVKVMLASLALEEPPAAEAFWKTSAAIGAVVVAFGVLFLIWGIVALAGSAKTGTVGLLGGSILLLFGAGFVFGGVYVVIKNLRQQGVL